MMNIAFFASHNGSAAQAITAACRDGRINAAPRLLITNNTGSPSLNWARDAGLKTAVINAANSPDTDEAIASLLEESAVDIAICSGYMKLIGPRTLTAVRKGILNTHPALLPRHGGKGMYGRHVHQAVFDAKDTETGVTIHLVDGEYDHGRVIAQKTLPVLPQDSVEDIEAKVKAAEPDFYIETLQNILSGTITL